MRINKKFYSDQDKKNAIDKLWDTKEPSFDGLLISVYHPSVDARKVFDCATPGVGWIIGTRQGQGDTSLAEVYATDDSKVLRIMLRLISMSDKFNKFRQSAWEKLSLLRAPVVPFPNTQEAIKELASDYRNAARAFWKFALTDND